MKFDVLSTRHEQSAAYLQEALSVLKSEGTREVNLQPADSEEVEHPSNPAPPDECG
jgi:hypothetical protein